MAIRPNYPGVYISETASVSHHVMPASTNLTAFIGVFPKGPIDRAVPVTSWAQFAQQFGGLDANSTLAAYAVWLFFANGGVGAWIVRLDANGTFASATIAPTAATPTELTVTANSPGAWASGLYVSLEPSSPASVAGTTHCDFFVKQAQPAEGLPASPVAPTYEVLEAITNLAVTGPDGSPVPAAVLASQISAASQYVTVGPAVVTSPVTPAASNALLSKTRDVVWNETTLLAQLEPQVQSGGLLDQIAPALLNIMCIPDAAWLDADSAQQLYGFAQDYCQQRRAFLIVDPPPPAGAGTPPTVLGVPAGTAKSVDNGIELLTAYGGFLGADKMAAAMYYPWLQITDPVTGLPRLVPPSGAVAGVYARTDTTRGVWTAPAGAESALEEVTGLADVGLNDTTNGTLNVVGINCLRTLPLYGTVVWGSRTLAGSDLGESPFKYVPVRRLADFIEQSLQQSLRWAVFEPNSASLWSSLSLEANQFMSGLFAAGAFEGTSSSQAFTVLCDATTTSPTDIQNGVVNLNVAFAPVSPAEFVMLNIQITAAAAAS